MLDLHRALGVLRLRPHEVPARSAARLASTSLVCAALLLAASAMALPTSTTPAGSATAAQAQPELSFLASGSHSHSSARITVDVRVPDGETLTVILYSPSGMQEVLSMRQNGNRYSWTGVLREPGMWRADASVGGASATASVSLTDSAPTCNIVVTGPRESTHYLDAQIIVNTCDARATVGQIATRYARVFHNGELISTLDSTERCERRFILQGGGSYRATLEVMDDRGVPGSCSVSGLAVEARYPRAWPTLDLGVGTFKTSREDLVEPGSAFLGGGAVGITLPRDSSAESTYAFNLRAAGGRAHKNWVGSSVDLALTRETPGGFLGGGVGAWGIGDSDLLDVALFGIGGFNLPNYTGAGQAQAFFEFRAFGKQLSNTQNNYAGIVGLRLNFRPTHRLLAR